MKQKLLKTMRLLLVAVLLGVGANDVWGDEVADINFNDNTVSLPFSIYNSNRIRGSYVLHDGSETDYFAKYTSTSGGVSFARYDFSSSVSNNAATITFEFDFNIQKDSRHAYISLADASYHNGGNGGFNSGSNMGYGSNGSIFYFGCWRGNLGGGNNNYFSVNGNGNSTLTDACLNKWCHANITVNNANRTVNYSITNLDGTAIEGASGTNIAFANTLAKQCSQIDIYIGSGGVSYVEIDNLSITMTKNTTSHNFTINAIAGDTKIKTLASATAYEGSVYEVCVPEVIKGDDGKFYMLTDEARASLSNHYNASYLMGTADAIKEIAYSENTSIVYFYEGGNSGNVAAYSCGGKGNIGTQNKRDRGLFGSTLPKGKYTLSVMFTEGDNNQDTSNSGRQIGIRHSSNDHMAALSGSTTRELKTTDFTITDDKTNLYINGANSGTDKANQSADYDYLYISKPTVTYTVEYKFGETTIKTADASRTAIWGTTVAITDADKENILFNHATYEYASDNASSITIASDGTSVITVEFTQVPFYTLADVTDAEIWDWSVITSGSSQLTSTTTPAKNELYVLKNVELYDGYSIPTGFGDAQKLKVRGEYWFRIANNTKFFQGSDIKFNTTVPGTLSVTFSNTGSNNERHLTVNGINQGGSTSNTTPVTASGIPVAAGEVALGSTENYLRFYKIVFTPNLEVINAIADCKTYETSTEFATYIDGGIYTTAAEVYAAHTAWQISHATVSDGKLDITKSILDAAVSELGGAKWNNANVWDGSSWNEKYTEEGGAPDNNYFDVYENTITAKQTIYGVPAGTYLIKAATRSEKDKGVTGNLWVFDGTSNIGRVDINSDGNTGRTLGKGWSWSKMTVTLTETKNLEIGFYADASSDAAWAGCDDWHMYKIESNKSLNASGYSTFSSSLNLQVTGADAYTAQLDLVNNKITCTKITDGKIPAGTGVLLYGENNAEVTFTVIESAPALSDNDLKATTLANGSLAAKGENTYYVLSGNTFMQYTGAAFAAGKAYFEVSGGAVQARKFTIEFDNESTGIQTVDNSQFTIDNYYNLNGQRVTQPAKGLYIVNGKKVLMK